MIIGYKKGDHVAFKPRGQEAHNGVISFEDKDAIYFALNDNPSWAFTADHPLAGYERVVRLPREVYTQDQMWLIKSSKTPMDMLEKLRISRLPEPNKTFRKHGIQDEDGDLTEDGEELFLNFLIEKFGAEFKKDVIDPIVAEEKACKKSQ